MSHRLAPTLRAFFESNFAPQQSGESTAGFVAAYRRAIDLLAKGLGREPTTADLDKPTIEQIYNTLVLSGLSRTSLIKLSRKVTAIWRDAAALGYAGPCTPPVADATEAMPPRWIVSMPDEGTVLRFYRQCFWPQMLKTFSVNSRSKYDSAMRYLVQFCSGPIELSQVSQNLIQRFEEWLRKKPLSEGTIAGLVRSAHRIMRSAAPGRIPVPTSGALRKLACDAERPPLVTEIKGERGTLLHYFTSRYVPERMVGRSPRSVKDYLWLLKYLRDCFGEDPRVAELSAAKLGEYVCWMSKRGCNTVTQHNNRARFLTLWRAASEDCSAPAVPRLSPFRVEQEEPDAWSLEEAKRIIRAAKSIQGKPILGIRLGDYWEALLLIGWYTAMRRSSLMRLRPRDVDLDAGWVYLPAKAVKNARGKGFRLGDDAITALRRIFDPKRELLFPSSSKEALMDQFTRILKEARVDKGSRKNNSLFHKWRRTVATAIAASQGLAAAVALLGHSGDYCLRFYIDASKLPGNDATKFLPKLSD